MSYRFVLTDRFQRDLKHLQKKNPHLDKDFKKFLSQFNHKAGAIISNTGGAQKIRMAITGKGKRASYRVVYYLKHGEYVFFLTVYAKGAKEDLTEDDKKVMRELIEEVRR